MLPGLYLFIIILVSKSLWGFYTRFRVLYFCEKVHWNFDKDCFDSVDSFWLYGHFNNINSFDLFVCAFFNFFHKSLVAFIVQIIHFFG